MDILSQLLPDKNQKNNQIMECNIDKGDDTLCTYHSRSSNRNQQHILFAHPQNKPCNARKEHFEKVLIPPSRQDFQGTFDILKKDHS